MIYSVWNQAAKAYDYYETPETADTANAPKPQHIPTGTIGATVDQIGWPLPSGAKKIGTGELPEGRIASTTSSVAAGYASKVFRYAVIGGIGYALWRWAGK